VITFKLMFSILTILIIIVAFFGVFVLINKFLLNHTIKYFDISFNEAVFGLFFLLFLMLWTPITRSSIFALGLSTADAVPPVFNLDIFQDLSLTDILKCFSGVILMASFEEIVFRGIIMGLFLRYGWIKAGVIISSLIFSIAHQKLGLHQLGYYFIAGLTFAIVVIKFGVVIAAIFHALYNFPVALELRMYIDGTGLDDRFSTTIPGVGLYIYTAFLSAPLLFFIFYLCISCKKQPEQPVAKQ
jgi:membrane protease YdiL (CAAX protease family)